MFKLKRPMAEANVLRFKDSNGQAKNFCEATTDDDEENYKVSRVLKTF
jgi:hypothetical protein